MAPRESSLLQQVVGAGGTPEGYLYGGFTTSVGLRGILMLIGRNITEFSKILDFGCGSARVVRWFRDLLPAALHGTDISEEAIQWSKENVSQIQFATNNHLPPLSFPDKFMDLVFGVSVLTHLDENYQNAWLEELYRVTQPGAIVMLSVHGEGHTRMALPEEQLQLFSEKGFLFLKGEGPTVEDLPDFYQVAYHALPYIKSTWSRFFEILLYVKNGPLYLQDLVVMRRLDSERATDSNASAEVPVVDLPIVCLDSPGAGQVINDGELAVDGWGFYPTKPQLDLDVWLDGGKVGSCAAKMSRPDVVDAFFGNENALSSGFSLNTSVQGLSDTPHSVWLTTDTVQVPLCASYFLVDST